MHELAQVGEQENMADLRAARIGVARSSIQRATGSGSSPSPPTVTKRGLGRTPREGLYDLEIEIPIGPVKLTLGKQEEPFSFEMVGLFPTLPRKVASRCTVRNTAGGLSLPCRPPIAHVRGCCHAETSADV